jgi:1-hydroxycarotenoid 3,4-desaturase
VTRQRHVVVIGAGAGGLAAASDLAHAGLAVTVLDRAANEGGKMRQVVQDGVSIDAGPTVFTMKWVFDALFAAGGADFARSLAFSPASVLARHAWRGGDQLDLYADIRQSADAISAFAGPREGAGYLAFLDECRDVHATLKDTFMAAQKPGPAGLVLAAGDLGAMWRTRPFETYWSRLRQRFTDPRLRQLFGRYSTYVGASPFRAPATLMLIAHVEQDGVWLLDGGMRALADAVRRLAEAGGARFRFGAEADEILMRGGRVCGVRLKSGEVIAADAAVFNGDVSALGRGLLGEAARRAAKPVTPAERSLSAVTWCVNAATSGMPLAYHNVFFTDDYEDEFDAVFRQRTITANPTVYICAQDRRHPVAAGAPERLLILANAPPDGDQGPGSQPDIRALSARVRAHLGACGLITDSDLSDAVVTTPADFGALFPATGGALYGRANHSPMASFARPGAASHIGGLYLAGGSVHPGPGVPMATLSGRLAASRLLSDMRRGALDRPA